ncbi:hypothetical protein HOC37_04100 [bacterium]|nr:hypothetical protein [bacterium]
MLFKIVAVVARDAQEKRGWRQIFSRKVVPCPEQTFCLSKDRHVVSGLLSRYADIPNTLMMGVELSNNTIVYFWSIEQVYQAERAICAYDFSSDLFYASVADIFNGVILDRLSDDPEVLDEKKIEDSWGDWAKKYSDKICLLGVRRMRAIGQAAQVLLNALWRRIQCDQPFKEALLATGDSVLIEQEGLYLGSGDGGYGLNAWGQLLMIARAYAQKNEGQDLGRLSAPKIEAFLPGDSLKRRDFTYTPLTGEPFFDPNRANRRAVSGFFTWDDPVFLGMVQKHFRTLGSQLQESVASSS